MTKKEFYSKFYVITDPQAGWDRVRGIYIANDNDSIEKDIDGFNEDDFILHHMNHYHFIDLIDAFDSILKDAFEAGRELKEPNYIGEPMENRLKYVNFEKYLKKLNQ